MHAVDIAIFALYLICMVGIGVFFMRRNKGGDDYFVGGRKMGSVHVGLSVVATDVGGGFSIGLGGLGFAMGLSGSWMLFTGLIGAWLSAVLLIPKLKRNEKLKEALTFPDFFLEHFGKRAALVAGVISAIGYLGFTSSQLLAGAKLAAGTFPALDTTTALVVMGVVAVVYTAMGGLKAVIYTDTVQWIILMTGLAFVGFPIAYTAVGGFASIRQYVAPEMLSLSNITWQTAVNWGVTIVPIWFVGMTLYQRVYACRDEKTAKRAWFIAGLFEWPIMAFLGVFLGLLARVAAQKGMLGLDPTAMDPESGLPILLRTVLPVGFMGLVMSAYFSAILSTADSCLMACSGNLVSDIFGRYFNVQRDNRFFLRLSQVSTLALGAIALVLAGFMSNVLSLMLYSYAFMVSGLFVPVLGALFGKRKSEAAAVGAMLTGGGTTAILEILDTGLPFDLDPNIFGVATSALCFFLMGRFVKSKS